MSVLNDALSSSNTTFQTIVLSCEQEGLIQSHIRKTLFDYTMPKPLQSRATDLITDIQTTVGIKPSQLQVFLRILREKGGIPGVEIAKRIARDYESLKNRPPPPPVNPSIYTAGSSGASSIGPSTITANSSNTSSTGSTILTSEDEKAKDVLRRHYPEMADLMAVGSNRLRIASALYGANLITESCYDEVTDDSPRTDIVKGHSLAKVVKNTINSQPFLFPLLIQTLSSVDDFSVLGEKLLNEFYN
jgi:hypothetical protein